MTYALDATFSALSDPTRRAIMARLAEGEATVLEIAAPFRVTQPSISRHLKVLEEAGLILRRIDGNRRPCRLAPVGLTALEDWLDLVRRTYSANYDRLDAVLDDLQKQEPKT